jgi:hypothetical protein
MPRSSRLPPGKRAGAHFTRDWMGLWAYLNGAGKSRFNLGTISEPLIA